MVTDTFIDSWVLYILFFIVIFAYMSASFIFIHVYVLLPFIFAWMSESSSQIITFVTFIQVKSVSFHFIENLVM